MRPVDGEITSMQAFLFIFSSLLEYIFNIEITIIETIFF